MLPMLIPILGFAIEHAPGLIGLLAGENAGAVAESVVRTVKDVLGTTDPVQAQAKVAADPALADELTARLNAEVETHKADLADLANARAQTVALAQGGSMIAWGAPVVSIIVIMGFILVTGALFFVKTDIPANLFALLNIVYGTMVSLATQVTSYWLGSSSGSQKKDTQIGNALERAAAPAGRAVANQIDKAARK